MSERVVSHTSPQRNMQLSELLIHNSVRVGTSEMSHYMSSIWLVLCGLISSPPLKVLPRGTVHSDWDCASLARKDDMHPNACGFPGGA